MARCAAVARPWADRKFHLGRDPARSPPAQLEPAHVARSMKRELLLELVAEAARIAGDRELVMIGSQVVHAATGEVPAEVVMSRECDLLLDESDPIAAAIDRNLGPDSKLAAERFVHVDIVSSTFPSLPAGWEDRLVSLAPAVPNLRCLEIHDLVIS